MVALRLLSANNDRRGRSLRAATPYYTRSVARRKLFALGEKPEVLGHVARIDKKVWKQYQSHLRRTTPLERAEFYAREMAAGRARSHRALSLLLGEPVNQVGQYMRLLALPDPIQEFLRQHREPQYLRYFSGRRLQELVRLADARAMWRRFRGMVEEADRAAGVWKASARPDEAPCSGELPRRARKCRRR